KVSNLSGFDTCCCYIVHLPCHCVARHTLLIDGLGVSLHLSQAGVTGDGGDFVHATAGLGKAPTSGFAQSVKTAFFWKPRCFAPRSELFAEVIASIWLAGPGSEKGQMSAWRGVDDGAQVRVDWNAQRGSGLLLLNGEDAVVDMLAPH